MKTKQSLKPWDVYDMIFQTKSNELIARNSSIRLSELWNIGVLSLDHWRNPFKIISLFSVLGISKGDGPCWVTIVWACRVHLRNSLALILLK